MSVMDVIIQHYIQTSNALNVIAQGNIPNILLTTVVLLTAVVLLYAVLTTLPVHTYYILNTIITPAYRRIYTAIIPRALVSIYACIREGRVQHNLWLVHDFTPSGCIYLYNIYVDITRAPIWGALFPFNAKILKIVKWQPSFFKTFLASRKIYTYIIYFV